MIDTAKAKHLRDQALRLIRSEGRTVCFIEMKGIQRRIVEYERGRLFIEYLSPRYPDNPMPKTARPFAYSISVRIDGSKVLSVAWDDTRTTVLLSKPGGWEQFLFI
jgi:hypothetical protein